MPTHSQPRAFHFMFEQNGMKSGFQMKTAPKFFQKKLRTIRECYLNVTIHLSYHIFSKNTSLPLTEIVCHCIMLIYFNMNRYKKRQKIISCPYFQTETNCFLSLIQVHHNMFLPSPKSISSLIRFFCEYLSYVF